MSTDAADGPADVEVVVGRIGKPHGLRGEVTVDVRTDEPERRFAPGSTLRAEPPPGSASSLRALTVAGSRRHQSRAAGHLRRAGRPHRGRGRPRHRAARHDPGRRVAGGPRRVLRPPAGRPRGVRRGRHAARHRRRARARRRPGPAPHRDAGRPGGAGAVREGAGARGRRGRRAGGDRGPARARHAAAGRTTSEARLPDDLPGVPGAAAAVAHRQGRGQGAHRAARPRPAGVDPRPAPHRRRRAVRRGSRAW